MQTDDSDVTPDEPVVSRRPYVFGVIGFVLGMVVMGLLWLAGGSGSGATEDARAACSAFDRAGTLPDRLVSESALAPGVLEHITAARDLSSAAAAQNPAYQELADHLDGVSRMVISLNFVDPAGRRHLLLAQQLCSRM